MKNVLVLAYAYYPTFHGGVPRVAAFCKYLPIYGWNPILLTHDSRDSGSFARTDKKDSCRVIRISTDMIRFDKKSSVERKFIKITRLPFKSLADMKAEEFEANLLREARSICAHDKIDAIVASSLPQYIHRVASILSREYNIPWIADHRDLVGQDNSEKYKWKLLSNIDKKFSIARDNKYDRTASRITTVSSGLADLLYKRSHCNAVVIPNGFDEEDFQITEGHHGNKKMTIVYAGSLFGDRQPDTFFEGLEKAVAENSEIHDRISVCFYGSCCKEISRMICVDRYQKSRDVVEFKGTVSHEDAIYAICNADILYLISHKAKGIATGKIYEYLAAKKTILSIPGDKDITDDIIKNTNSGYVAGNANEVCRVLTDLFAQWKENGMIEIAQNPSAVNQFNRKYQTQKLAEILDEITTA